MALNSSGPISLAGTTSGQSIEIENGGTGTAQISLNDTAVRSLAGPAFATPASQISMPADFWGKSNQYNLNLVTSVDLDLRTYALANGWGGSSKLVATLPSGSTISASSTSAYALTIAGSFPGGVTFINQGAVYGRGGDGGTGGSISGTSSFSGTPGVTGGPGILVSVACTINNTSGSINGGGGGGGGGGACFVSGKIQGTASGSGGGGGIGNSSGGAAGSAGGPARNVTGNAGGGGTLIAIGLGGPPVKNGTFTGGYGDGGAGGNGGAYGSSGSPGGSASATSGTPGSSGGATGNALSGIANVTWAGTGTINGPTV